MNNREKLIFQTLPKLVMLGRNELLDIEKLPSPFAYGVFDRNWSAVLSDWLSQDIFYLIKGFVFFERLKPENNFGSVSPIPEIFSFYALISSQQESDFLADWVLANCVNYLCPFGSQNFGAKSLIELSLINKTRSEMKIEFQKREAGIAQTAKERRAIAATRSLPKAIKRRDTLAVHALIKKGADPDFLLEDGRTARTIATDLALGQINAIL